MNEEIRELLFKRGADFVRFIDILDLPANQTRGFPKAVVFCMALSRDFIIAKRDEKTMRDEFADKERETDALADWLANYIRGAGRRAFSQSEKNLLQNDSYDEEGQKTLLPHKTIARHGGLGYIGKNNLLITEEFGPAFSMCTVLTDAPVETENRPLVPSKCEDCDICKQACPDKAIFGNEWNMNAGRENVVDVFRCTCALQCVVNCPQALKYAMQPEL